VHYSPHESLFSFCGARSLRVVMDYLPPSSSSSDPLSFVDAIEAFNERTSS